MARLSVARLIVPDHPGLAVHQWRNLLHPLEPRLNA